MPYTDAPLPHTHNKSNLKQYPEPCKGKPLMAGIVLNNTLSHAKENL